MPSTFLPCRHRLEPRTRRVYHCRSPKMTGLMRVTSDLCDACPFPDHHHPGEPAPFVDIHPEMSAEQLAELLNQPARAWPPGWEDWEVTHRAHQLAADQFLAALPPFPDGQYRGKGIVLVGGGPAYFPSLYVAVRATRHVGWNLPIQVWYLGRENEMTSRHQALLEALGVECVDADAVRATHPCRILNGWELKAFAALHSPFEEVLFLDADCYPVRDPGLLWEDNDYRQTGAVFWPDLDNGPPLDWRPFGIDPPGRRSIESGQFLINKRLCWRPLQLAWWYNDHSDWSYLHGYGDKHTFEVAWAKCGQLYSRFREDVEWSLHSFKHVGPDGELLFVHRCKDKFRFGEPDPRYMNPQTFAANVFHPGLPLERECFAWLEELKEALEMTPRQPGTVRRNVPLRAFAYTCPERYDVWEKTLQRWRATDWGEDPVVIVDEGTGAPSTGRIIANTRRMLSRAREQEADYYLFLEDDLLFNLYLGHNVRHWRPLQEGWLWMGSLYNPGIRPTADTNPETARQLHFAQAGRDFYYGTQAIILSRAAVSTVLDEWDEPGPFDLKLAKIAQRHSPGIILHHPSLVQHVPVASSWGGSAHRARDFDPFYRA